MSEPYVGEIRMFAGNFAPQGWAFCDGQLLAVAQNDALFSLFGTTYGGDGRTTFGLPDLRGRVPIHAGSGPGLSQRKLGSRGGTEQETVTVNQLPAHAHDLQATADTSTTPNPGNNTFARSVGDVYAVDLSPQAMNANAVTAVGGSQAHENLMPFLCVNFIVSLFGIYPSRQ